MKQFKSLRMWRRSRRFNQRQAAALLQTTQGSYHRWELGLVMPRPAMQDRIYRLTGVSLQHLLRRSLKQKSRAFRAHAKPSLQAKGENRLQSDNVCSVKKQNPFQTSPPAPALSSAETVPVAQSDT